MPRAVTAGAGRPAPTSSWNAPSCAPTSARRQAATGHLPVTESRPLVPAGPRYHYTHLNNTNPLADRAADERAMLDPTAPSVAEDGQVLEICAGGA